jgi:hypothetical protein
MVDTMRLRLHNAFPIALNESRDSSLHDNYDVLPPLWSTDHVEKLKVPPSALPFMGRLGGVVVSVPATRPKVRGFEPGQRDGFLRAIKIRSRPSSRMGSKAGGRMSLDFTAWKRTLKSHGDE